MQATSKQTEHQAVHAPVKSFNIVKAITDKNLFSSVKLSPTARLVLFNLANMYNLKKGYSFPKVKKLVLCTGATEKSVISSLNELRVNNLIVSSRDDYKTNYYFTKKFFNLLQLLEPENISDEPENISELPVKITATCHEQKKEQNIKQKDNFSFKNLLELIKTNTIEYYEQILNLSDADKEKLLKIKLQRTALTNFQQENLEKLILLNDYEIQKVNSLEPYFKQENINIFYNARLKKIREYKEQTQVQEIKTATNERDAALSFLRCGYKTNINNRLQLSNFLNRNKDKMQQFNITEIELCS